MKSAPSSAALAVLLTLSSAGCAFGGRVVEDSVSYNRAVAEAGNELLLLNVLRAKERHPMYFTGLSQIRGNLRGSVTGGATVPVGGDAADVYPLTASGTYTTNPTFDVAVLDSEKFMRGILTPVGMTTVQYYWEQGWPSDVLLHLLVDRIEVGGETYVNRPGGEDHAAFAAYVETLRSRNVRIGTAETQVTLALPDAALEDLGDVVGALKEKYTLDQSGASTVLKRVVKAPRFEWDDDGGRSTLMDPTQFEQFQVEPDSDEGGGGAGAGTSGKAWLRSPQAVLYYLGELTRAVEEGGPAVRVGGAERAGPGEPEALFVLVPIDGREGPWIVRSDYGGRSYGVPAGVDGGRTMQCLTLVSQLLALQKSSDELPSTSAVTLVGG